MFPTSVIRSLARSEEMFAETHNFVGLTAHMKGPVDIDAMSAAFDALIETHPVLAGHLEELPDGRHQIVVDDLLHPGMEVVEVDNPDDELEDMFLDQASSLVQLRLTIRNGQPEPTFYIHHCVADGHHQFSFVEELFSSYTALVSTGKLRPANVEPAPQSLEEVLAERGIEKQRRSGLERFMPAMFAHELPPSRRATTDARPTLPMRVPVTRCRLTEPETRQLIDYCRTHRLRTNAVFSAAILMAEWRLRDTPHIPVPYIYPVDLRYFLSPPVSATGCTNPLGVATYLARIDDDTAIADLARDIAESFQADVSEGVVQQSLLHFSPQYVGNPPGLPDVVMFTDNGLIPDVRTPDGVELTACHSDMYFAVNAGIDMYSGGIFADRLFIEHHSHAQASERSTDLIRTLLCSVADQHAATGVG
jgi:phenolphthiocerol/phthiocerol/phthiodiolone dimycocerosyl transferase